LLALLIRCRYEELHQYDEAIRVAYSRNHPNAAEIASGYFQMLVKSGQEEKAGMLKEQAGEVDAAIDLYLKVRVPCTCRLGCATLTRSRAFCTGFDRLIVQGGLPGKAASLASHPQYQQTPEKLEMIAVALAKAGLSEKAGEFYDKLNMSQKAMTVYRQSASLSFQACEKLRPCNRSGASVWRAYAIAKSSHTGPTLVPVRMGRARCGPLLPERRRLGSARVPRGSGAARRGLGRLARVREEGAAGMAWHGMA
jgi:hypothetical protein